MSNKAEQPYWLAFRVAPQKETVAETIAKQNGLTAVVPTETRTRGRNVRKSKKEIQYPKVNGYVFIQFTGPCDWLTLSRLTLIKSVVGFNGRPAKISNAQMNYFLKSSSSKVPHIHSSNTRHGFVEGDVVEVTQGPLINSLVPVQEIIGNKARVLFKILGVEREVEIELKSLDAA